MYQSGVEGPQAGDEHPQVEIHSAAQTRSQPSLGEHGNFRQVPERRGTRSTAYPPWTGSVNGKSSARPVIMPSPENLCTMWSGAQESSHESGYRPDGQQARQGRGAGVAIPAARLQCRKGCWADPMDPGSFQVESSTDLRWQEWCTAARRVRPPSRLEKGMSCILGLGEVRREVGSASEGWATGLVTRPRLSHRLRHPQYAGRRQGDQAEGAGQGAGRTAGVTSTTSSGWHPGVPRLPSSWRAFSALLVHLAAGLADLLPRPLNQRYGSRAPIAVGRRQPEAIRQWPGVRCLARRLKVAAVLMAASASSPLAGDPLKFRFSLRLG